MMKSLVKQTKNFNNLEADSIFLKDGRGYFTTNNMIVPFSKRKISCNDYKLNKLILCVHNKWNGNYSEAITKLIDYTDKYINTNGGMPSPSLINYSQDKMRYFPWLAPIKALFRAIIRKPGDREGFALVVDLVNVEKFGYMSPFEKISFYFKFDSGQRRYYLTQVIFEKIDDSINKTYIISDANTEWNISFNNGFSRIVTTGNNGYSDFWALTTGGSSGVPWFNCFGEDRVGSSRDNNALAQFYETIFKSGSQLSNLISENAITYVNEGYDDETDIDDLNRLITISWFRKYKNASTAIINNNSLFDYCANYIITRTPGNPVKQNYINDRDNFKRNASQNSDPTFVISLINNIENNNNIAGSFDKYVVKNSDGNVLYELEAIMCDDNYDVVYPENNVVNFYIKKTSRNVSNVMYIDKTNNQSLFGNANLPVENFVYKEAFIDNSSGKTTESTLIFQTNSEGYVTINHIFKKN